MRPFQSIFQPCSNELLGQVKQILLDEKIPLEHGKKLTSRQIRTIENALKPICKQNLTHDSLCYLIQSAKNELLPPEEPDEIAESEAFSSIVDEESESIKAGAHLDEQTPVPRDINHQYYHDLRTRLEDSAGFPCTLPEDLPVIFVQKWQQAFYLTLRGFTPEFFDRKNERFIFLNSSELRQAYYDYHQCYEKFILAAFSQFRARYQEGATKQHIIYQQYLKEAPFLDYE